MSRIPGTSARTRRGAILIVVLWAVVVLSLLAGGLTFAVRQDTAISGLELDRTTAHWLARAGVERAIAVVMEADTLTVALDDVCCDNPVELKEIALTGGTFSVLRESQDESETQPYGATDESGKLNINTATREQLMGLPRMTVPVAAAILDWRDSNEQPEPDGIERGYYAGLPHPYVIRNGLFRTVRELLLVRGVTPELFYGEDANLNGRLEGNEDDGDASEPLDNADGRLDRGWAAYVTAYSYDKNQSGTGMKRLNINSADASSIAQRCRLEDWAAESIVRARQQGEFKTLSALLDVRRDSGQRAEADRGQNADLNNRSDAEKDHAVTRDILARIIDDITLTNDETLPGRINVNTAPPAVLKTIPGIDEDIAHTIVQMREGRGGLASVGELLEITSLSNQKFGQLENSVTVRSSVFRIHSVGSTSSGLGEAVIECVVDRGASGGVPRILYWLESAP